MPRHIDEAQHIAASERHIGKTKVDGQATLFLFRQAVRIDAAQRFNQFGLAMIHMAGCGDNHVAIITM